MSPPHRKMTFTCPEGRKTPASIRLCLDVVSKKRYDACYFCIISQSAVKATLYFPNLLGALLKDANIRIVTICWNTSPLLARSLKVDSFCPLKILRAISRDTCSCKVFQVSMDMRGDRHRVACGCITGDNDWMVGWLMCCVGNDRYRNVLQAVVMGDIYCARLNGGWWASLL